MSLISRNLANQMMFDSNIELIDIRWLQQWSAYPPTKMTAEETGELIIDIAKNGIKDPALLVINPISQEIRLDSGNHRVYFMPILGVTTLPVICFVTSGPVIMSEANGSHVYTTDCITANTDFDAAYYARPSSVLNIQ